MEVNENQKIKQFWNWWREKKKQFGVANRTTLWPPGAEGHHLLHVTVQSSIRCRVCPTFILNRCSLQSNWRKCRPKQWRTNITLSRMSPTWSLPSRSALLSGLMAFIKIALPFFPPTSANPRLPFSAFSSSILIMKSYNRQGCSLLFRAVFCLHFYYRRSPYASQSSLSDGDYGIYPTLE